MTDDKYTYCPDCHRKGVYLVLGRGGRGWNEDGYKCRYCDFNFYTASDLPTDRTAEKRWQEEQTRRI